MIRQYFNFILFLITILSCQDLIAQDQIIRLQNPSFEDPPRAGRAPTYWNNCGFPGETAPDVQPGEFGAFMPAYDGNTYLGMVVRDNDSWERVSQRLSKPILANQCYSFSIFMARSNVYYSQSQSTGQMVQYAVPSVLRIWGGNGRCTKMERLAESDVVTAKEWQQFDFKFEPTQTHTYIIFEVFYKTPTLFPYNGNILLDNASPITPIPCDEALAKVLPPIVEFVVPEKTMKVSDQGVTVQAQIKQVSPDTKVYFKMNGRPISDFNFNPDTGVFQADLRKFKEGKNTLLLTASNSGGDSQDNATLVYEKSKAPAIAKAPVSPPPAYEQPSSTPITPDKPAVVIKEDKQIEGMSRKDMKTGQKIPINKLYFGANQRTIGQNSYDALDEIFEFLKYNEDVAIEIGGHTNGNCDDEFCDELSEIRAKAVADYLVQKGIEQDRLKYKGYGKRDPISSNKTAVGRKKNQRVEIKILSMNG